MPTRLEQATDTPLMSIVVESDSDDPLDVLRALKRADQQVDVWLRQGVATARERGTSWSSIAEAPETPEQSAWAYYNADIRALVDRTAATSDLSDDEARVLEVDEVRAARREHRGS